MVLAAFNGVETRRLHWFFQMSGKRAQAASKCPTGMSLQTLD
jgi:hypothetical protein